MGGLSREREISLRSGKAVAQALRSRGYQIVEIDVGRDVARKLISEKVEIAFIVLHGRYGEDGAIQGLLEILGIPYTGSGVLGSSVGLDKELTKRLAASEGVRTPQWCIVSATTALADSSAKPASAVVAGLPVPFIIKPNREGSTIGMSIVRRQEEFSEALRKAADCDETILIEQFITGREVTVSVIDGQTLPVLEIVPKSGFYDFASKYTKGMTEYIVPAPISEKVQSEVSRATEKVYSLLKLSGVARADFIIDANDQSYFLEINTIPGMTETSLVPKSAAAAGVSFEELCERILKGASLKS